MISHAPETQEETPFATISGHRRPHIPQCEFEDPRSASQPSAASRLQSSNPPKHAKLQAPRAQDAVAFARDGHELAQRPQCIKSDMRSASQPSALVMLQLP